MYSESAKVALVILKVGVMSLVKLSVLSVPVSLVPDKSIDKFVRVGSVGSVSIVTLKIPLVPERFPAESFATAVNW